MRIPSSSSSSALPQKILPALALVVLTSAGSCPKLMQAAHFGKRLVTDALEMLRDKLEPNSLINA